MYLQILVGLAPGLDESFHELLRRKPDCKLTVEKVSPEVKVRDKYSLPEISVQPWLIRIFKLYLPLVYLVLVTCKRKAE